MNSQKTSSRQDPPKREYISPALQIYGNLAQITAMNGMTGIRDAAGGGNHNTRP